MEFYDKIAQAGLGTLTSRSIGKVQLRLCTEEEQMHPEVLEDALIAMQDFHIGLWEIGQNCPALHPELFTLLAKAVEFEKKVLLYINPALLLLPEGERLLEVLRAQKAAIRMDFPFANEMDKEGALLQQGNDFYEKTIAALKKLNVAGYGMEEDLALHLCYKPKGAVLPEAPAKLEQNCKDALQKNYGIIFHKLTVLANHPVGCFAKAYLAEKPVLEAYRNLLEKSFAAEAVQTLPCLNQIYVDVDGSIYDCEHSAAIGLGVRADVTDIRFFKYALLWSRPIQAAGHCFACTARKAAKQA